MDLWFIIKERYMFLSIPIIIIIGSLGSSDYLVEILF